MEERDRAVLADFDALWARVQPAHAEQRTRLHVPACPQTDDEQGLRHMIDQTTADT